MDNIELFYKYLTRKKDFNVTKEVLEDICKLIITDSNNDKEEYIKLNIPRLLQYCYKHIQYYQTDITIEDYITNNQIKQYIQTEKLKIIIDRYNIDKDITATDCIVFDKRIILDRNMRNISFHRVYNGKPIYIDTDIETDGRLDDKMIDFINNTLYEKYWKDIIIGKEVYINNTKVNLFSILSKFFSSIDMIRRDFEHNESLISKTKDYILLDNKVVYKNKILPWKNLNIV